MEGGGRGVEGGGGMGGWDGRMEVGLGRAHSQFVPGIQI